MLCDRLQPVIISARSPDQAAYRKEYSTPDHVLAVTLLVDGCAEWNQDMWIGLVDFEKSFDAVELSSLWMMLRSLGVGEGYIGLLQKMRKHQTATVIAGAESRAFNLSRGVKQGDPISALLFIPVMEVCFRNLKKSWHGLNKPRLGQYYGMVVDRPGDPLTHRRFADDVLLIAESKGRVIEMPADLKKEAALYGLVVHMGKTKALTNVTAYVPHNCAGGRGPGRGETYCVLAHAR